ncbi:MAG: VOC family protein [Vicinamibacteria bacterium]|nr:VOC family protein [Vicinamibacteria bacterium]
MRPAREALDHLLIGAPVLEQGIEWLEEKTGVRAMVGGSHPGLGTWNALASLGPEQYIEIIAPDPAQPTAETFYVPGLRNFEAPRVTTWAARGKDLADGFLSRLSPGLVCGPTRTGERVRPDGVRLAWRLAFPRQQGHGVFDGALPFLIDWESPDHHPGRSAPPGLTLQALRFRHPRPPDLQAALAALGIEAEVAGAAAGSIEVELETPRGRVHL